MVARAVLILIRISDSFCDAIAELADELGVDLANAGEEQRSAHPAALIVAAGGEEDRGLDELLSRPGDEAPIYFVGATDSHRFAIEALRRGASDYFCLPAEFDLLRRTLTARVHAVSQREPEEADADPFSELLGSSEVLTETLERARRVMRHGELTVLLGGETGTGKELLARALHRGGPRAEGPFVAVNCAAIPSELLESELFGHERGAFTDAHQDKRGLFEEAVDGTLLLDEIGHLPLHLQGKLLRALEEGRIRRVGSNQTRAVNVRIMAATHVDLNQAVQRGEFREDLFYRLNVVSLTLPPLRERNGDVELLAERFIQRAAERYGLEPPPLTPEVRDELHRHDWPGNIRELRFALERAVLLSPPGTIDTRELNLASHGAKSQGGVIPFPAPLEEIERAAARAAVARADGNKSRAARNLGISRSRLARLLRSEGDSDPLPDGETRNREAD